MEPFLGQITLFAGVFAPRNYAKCNGQLMAIAQNSALFSLLGAVYGGDGRSSFALPDLRGRVPVHWGTGLGLTPRPIGQRGGMETVTLVDTQMPSHSHTMQANSHAATSKVAVGAILAADDPSDTSYSSDTTKPIVDLSPQAVNQAGGGQPHGNMAPYLVLNYIIATKGEYPSRN